ncbi:MAG: flippase-like domain-containing protein [Nitrospinae bacterium]|nr:flippase-like domain-containing protein [Nitrospinota bacterium]
MNKTPLIILLWVFAAGLFYLCLQSIDLDQAWNEISKADPIWLFLAVFFNACILGIWSSLWYLLLPKKLKVPFARVFQANSFMSTSCNTIPFPGGHAVGVMALARRAKVGHTVALSVLALDQLMEGFAKIFVLTLVAFFVPLPEPMRQVILVFIIIVCLLASIMFYMSHNNPDTLEGEEALSYTGKIRNFISRWSSYLEILRDMRIFSLGLLLALIMMFVQTLGIWAVQRGLNLDLPIWAPILVMGALNLATVLPITPGNFGVYEGTAFLVYKFCGLTPELALSLALLQHLCFLVPMVGAGYLVLVFLTAIQKENLSKEKWVADET